MSENKLPLHQMPMTELEARQQNVASSLEKTRHLLSTLGTSSFEATHVTPKAQDRVKSLFDLSDPDNPEFIDNAIRIGEVKKALTVTALPTLQAYNDLVTSELERRVEEERQQIASKEHIEGLRLKVEKLQQLKSQGFLPTDEALTKAQEELFELEKSVTQQPEMTEEPVLQVIEPIKETIRPQEKRISKIQQVEEALLRGFYTAEEIAEAIGLPDTSRIHSYISKLELKLDGTVFYIERKKFGEEKTQRFGIVKEEKEEKTTVQEENQPAVPAQPEVVESMRAEQTTNQKKAAVTTDEQAVQKKESPFSHPIGEAREKILLDIISGKVSLEEVLATMGTMKNGRPFGRGQAWLALSKSANFLYIRVSHKRKNLTSGEISLWEAAKELAGTVDNAKAFPEFKNRINDFFGIQGKEKEANAITQVEKTPALLSQAEAREDEKPVENPLLQPEEVLSLAWMVKSHHDIVIKSPDGKSVHYKVPQEIVDKCTEILKSNKPKGKLNVIDETSPMELRDRTLGKILENFEDDEKALTFVEQHDLSVQEILFWLDGERNYVFELLLHQITTEHKVNQKRLDLIDTARVVAGFNNGKLEALQKRIASLAEREKQQMKEQVETMPVQEEAPEATIPVTDGETQTVVRETEEAFDEEMTGQEDEIRIEKAENEIEEESTPVELHNGRETTITTVQDELQNKRTFGLEKSQPDIRNRIQTVMTESLKMPEFSSDMVTGAQLSRAYPRLKASVLDRLVEERVVRLVETGRGNRNQCLSRQDAILAVLSFDLKLNKQQQKDLRKIVSEEFQKNEEQAN